ncbi:hypothetical protein GOP47_0003471 [Adiantum capillus-veneris]|uniref:FAS1 domain-containing protein n=1 Tax=Adiantum capillus-veneris TaxID=13818 RepID=A0A9D4VCI1_ADICA|nr:hypothetical protein GOP47_0003471 [Adiantum capillus-veneris]
MARASSRFVELPPAQKISLALTLLVGILCASPFSVISAIDFSSPSSNKSMQARLVQALNEEGKYSAAATFLGAVDLNHVLPESSTIFVPMDEGIAESGLQLSTFNTAMPILQYHVIVKRLVFHDLQQLPVGQTLQTLLPNNTVIITSNSSANFTIDDVLMSHRNLFVASSTVVHGMNGVLNSDLYGRMTHLPAFQPSSPPGVSAPDIGSPPAHDQPAPPFTGNSSNTGTNSSSFPPAISRNVSSPPPSPLLSINRPPSPPPLQAGNGSSSSLPPVSTLPVASPPSLNSPPASQTQVPAPAESQTQVPATPAQSAASPQLQSSVCVGEEVVTCKPFASSSHKVNDLSFSLPALLVLGIPFVAGLYAMPCLPLLCMVLAVMAATPAKGQNNGVAELLRSRGGFGYAATFFEAADIHRVLPNRSTVLVPTDAALDAAGLLYQTLGVIFPVLQYHVITSKLLFKDLQMLPVGEMLETMLPKASLLVTSNTPWNFTLNDVLLSHPDILCFNGSAMHGIAGVMNYSQAVSSIPPPTTDGQQLPTLAPPLPPQLTLPLPESAAPFAVPLPVSHAGLLKRGIIDNRSTFIIGMILLFCALLIRSF